MPTLSRELISKFFDVTEPEIARWHAPHRKDHLFALLQANQQLYAGMDWDGPARAFIGRIIRVGSYRDLLDVLSAIRKDVGEDRKPAIDEVYQQIEIEAGREGLGGQPVDKAGPELTRAEADAAAAVDILGWYLQRGGVDLISPTGLRRSSEKAIRLWALGMPLFQMYEALPSIHAFIEEYDPADFLTAEDIVQLAEIVCTHFRDIMAGVIGVSRRGLNCSLWLRALSPDSADPSQIVVFPLAFSDRFDGRPVVSHRAYESSIAAALSGVADAAGNDWLPQQSHCFCCNNLLVNEFTTPTRNWRRFFKSVLAFPIRKRGKYNRSLKDYGYLRFDSPEVGAFDNMPCAFQYSKTPWQYSGLLDARPEFYLGGIMAHLLLLALDKPSAGLDEVSNAA